MTRSLSEFNTQHAQDLCIKAHKSSRYILHPIIYFPHHHHNYNICNLLHICIWWNITIIWDWICDLHNDRSSYLQKNHPDNLDLFQKPNRKWKSHLCIVNLRLEDSDLYEKKNNLIKLTIIDKHQKLKRNKRIRSETGRTWMQSPSAWRRIEAQKTGEILEAVEGYKS